MSKTNIFFAAIIVFLLALGAWAVNQTQKLRIERAVLRDQIDTLKSKFIALEKDREVLKKREENFIKAILNLQSRDRDFIDSLRKKDAQIANIKKRANENIDRINHYGADSLREYFSREFSY